MKVEQTENKAVEAKVDTDTMEDLELQACLTEALFETVERSWYRSENEKGEEAVVEEEAVNKQEVVKDEVEPTQETQLKDVKQENLISSEEEQKVASKASDTEDTDHKSEPLEPTSPAKKSKTPGEDAEEGLRHHHLHWMWKGQGFCQNMLCLNAVSNICLTPNPHIISQWAPTIFNTSFIP